ncbi:hypothetical protein KSS87_020817 [Heliosperma pusillum]|nr:hypothetical protein KSS87_020817 [Heliosperma pusillum]
MAAESGNVYIQRHIPANTQSHQGTFANNLSSKLQHAAADLFPKSPNVNSLPSSYTSVCTLDKVRVALDRAERSSQCWSRKRLAKETEDEGETCLTLPSGQNGLLVAAACPGCFLYVLISKNDPKCPNCNSPVQLPVMMIKKPKIDLNL